MKSNIFGLGDIGTGKTTSLRTLLPYYWDEDNVGCEGAGLEPFVISIAPGIAAALGPNLCNGGFSDGPKQRIHWHYLPPRRIDWATSRSFAQLANTLSIEQLTKMDDPKRSQYTELLSLYNICQNFKCHGCGEEFGDVGEWGEDRAIAIDELTGLTTICRTAICGGSPFLSLPKIGGIQGLIEGFMDLLWGNTNCTAILLAHIEREIDPLTSQSMYAPSTIGQKLAPKLLKKPDESFIYHHENGKYTWSTIDPNINLKHRRLPESSSLKPNFAQLFNS